MRATIIAALLLAAAGSVDGHDEGVRLYAAGSLREAMTEMAQAFADSGAPRVTAEFGASGLLRGRLEKGEAADVFASADLGNAQSLAQARRAGPPVVFARNRLCALVAPGFEVTPATLLDRMLDAKVRLGTSTPQADPSGDYAWQLFRQAETLRAGSYALLDAKALKLTGGPGSPQPSPGQSIYAVLIAQRQADIFLTYCTNAAAAVREVPGARQVSIPEPLAVGATYALAVANDARPAGLRFALFVLSTSGQGILQRHGFTPVTLP